MPSFAWIGCAIIHIKANEWFVLLYRADDSGIANIFGPPLATRTLRREDALRAASCRFVTLSLGGTCLTRRPRDC